MPSSPEYPLDFRSQVVSMDRPVDDDCSPGVGINSEEEYELNNDYYTVGPFKVRLANTVGWSAVVVAQKCQ